MYPNITLQIKNSVPKVIYFPEEGMSRVLTLKDESMEEVLTNIVKELGLYEEVEKSDQNNLEYIYALTFEGDNRLIEVVPGMDAYKNEFGFTNFVNEHLEKALSEKNDFSEYKDVTDEVVAELERNQSIDILASMFDILINVIIAKTLLFSSDLGIGRIHLEDLDGIVRLREKMASELSKMDIELHIID